MARRKSRRAQKPVKKVQKLDTLFTCPFCNLPESVHCDFFAAGTVAEVGCIICGASYMTKCNSLTEPVDVYSEWIDECDRVNNKRTRY